jgi:hypothetical protein
MAKEQSTYLAFVAICRRTGRLRNRGGSQREKTATARILSHVVVSGARPQMAEVFVKEEKLRIRLLWQWPGGRGDFGMVGKVGKEESWECQDFVTYFRWIWRDSQMASVLSKKKNCGSGFCCNTGLNGATSEW